MTVDFKDGHTPESVILRATFFSVIHTLSYREPVKTMAECSANVGHTALKGWVVKYAPAIAITVEARKQITAESWQMDEIYIKAKRRWGSLYWAVDKCGTNLGGSQCTNLGLKFSQTLRWIDISRVKYLNNISEQDPSFISLNQETLGFS